ncbi:hypothetical protein A2U01_0084144, partial [Trifolium medium]|nr:hypothetical protein [Trifolium medium]
EKAKSPKQGKRTPASGSLKHVLYGPKRTWSKGIPPVEPKKKNLKRKEVSSSGSDFVIEEDAVEIASTSAKASGGGRKRARTVPP